MKLTLNFARAAVVAAAALVSGTALAADLPTKGPVYKAPVADAWNPWMIRVRALAVVTRNSGSVDQVAGSGLTNSDQVVPELDITYFFTRNIAAELVLGVTRHHVAGTAALAGVDVGKATLLPPTLTLQYHFTQFGAFKPYVGAGVNYTWFFNNSAAGGVITQLTVKDTAGLALQGGFDYMIDKHWGFNFDVKWLYLRPSFSANNGALTGKLNIDPWLIGTGLVYKF